VKAEDYLSKATRELRETGEAPPREVDAVRARIMSTMRKSGRQRSRTMLWLLPIAAVLAASTALATGGAGLRRVWHQLLGRAQPALDRPAIEPASPPAPPTAPSVAVATPSVAGDILRPAPIDVPAEPAPAVRPAPQLAPPVANEPVANEPPAPKSGPKTAARPSASPEREAPPIETINTPDPEADRDAGTLVLYKKAHRLHFQEQKWAEALDAWNDYLREQPNGALSVEARYNRALALVRLGRRDDARAALAPFARGEVAGGYRAAEAKSLLSALEGSAR
jgi:hypothetical protein